jgi:hypothetical protein
MRRASGRRSAEVRRFYAALFEASPALHSHILQRVSVGGFVVDHERVTGRAGGDVDILITYDVREGRIQRVWFVREPLPGAVSVRRATVHDTDAVVAIGVETYLYVRKSAVSSGSTSDTGLPRAGSWRGPPTSDPIRCSS